MELYICLALSIYGFTMGARYHWMFQLVNIFASTVFITNYFKFHEPKYVEIVSMFVIMWITTKFGEKIRRIL